MQTQHATGLVAGRYELGDLLGRGGMAEVYAAVDLRLERSVAVKMLRPEMAARPDVRARFEAEARAAAGLCHPNTVAVYDTGESDGVPFLVMERLPGQTLADRIAAGPLDPAWVREAAVGVLGALDAAHQAGIVHRDVKPGNILITDDGRAKIADFGIAKSIHPADDTDAGRDLTITGQLLGTPAYLAPERLEGERATPRSDLWALAVVLYEALTGVKPFSGRTPLDVSMAIVRGEHTPLNERLPGIDPAMAAAVERAMAPHPEDRFADAAAMAAALEAPAAPDTVDVLAGGGTMVLPTLRATPNAHRARPPRRRRVAKPVDWSRRPPWLVWAVAAAAVVLAVVMLARAGGRDAPASAAGSSPSSTGAPTTTTPGQALATQLRDVADRLGTADGSEAGDLATSLRRVADEVASGSSGAGADATGVILTVATWNRAGQLTDGAAVAAVQVLQQVPGVSVNVSTNGSPSVSGNAPAPTAAPSGNGKAKGKAKGNED